MLAAGIVLYTGMTVSATGTGNAPVPSAGVGEILEAKMCIRDRNVNRRKGSVSADISVRMETALVPVWAYIFF